MPLELCFASPRNPVNIVSVYISNAACATALLSSAVFHMSFGTAKHMAVILLCYDLPVQLLRNEFTLIYFDICAVKNSNDSEMIHKIVHKLIRRLFNAKLN